GRGLVMRFSAEDDNIESRRSIAIFYRHGQMIETADVQGRIRVGVFIGHGTPPKRVGVMECWSDGMLGNAKKKFISLRFGSRLIRLQIPARAFLVFSPRLLRSRR